MSPPSESSAPHSILQDESSDSEDGKEIEEKEEEVLDASQMGRLGESRRSIALVDIFNYTIPFF